jgi:RNA recognition motif-containing protein
MTKLFVGGLPYAVSDQELNDLFAEYGTVVSATIIMDRQTGRSKGFGFVELEDDAMAQKAVEEMNGKDVDGRSLAVSVARPREERPRM